MWEEVILGYDLKRLALETGFREEWRTGRTTFGVRCVCYLTHFTFLGREEEILTKLKSSTIFTIEDSESHEIQGANSAESKATNVLRNNKKGLNGIVRGKQK